MARLRERPLTPSEFRRLSRSRRATEDYRKSLDAAKFVREDGLSKRAAAKKADVSVSVMSRYVGSILRKDSTGKWVPDTATRRARIVGLGNRSVAGPDQFRTAMDYNHAVGVFFRTGNESVLTPFRSVKLGAGKKKFTLQTDPDKLKEIGFFHGGIDKFLETGDGNIASRRRK
jgi:hypothetical protein